MPITVAYWKIRGLLQPIRLLLEYTGEKYEDKQYECGPAPDFDRSCWTDVKYSLGLDFPNLPYMIDGDVKITQSNAILRYIARKHDLCGSTDQERALVDMMADEGMDFRNGWVRLCYNPKFEELKDGYYKNVQGKIDSYEKFLGDKQWFAGDKLTFVDFVMYELLDQHQVWKPEILDGRLKLQAFLKRFEALPAIKSYMESDKFLKRPINNPSAKFV